MAQREPIRVQIEGLDDLTTLVKELRRATEEFRRAARAFKDAPNADSGGLTRRAREHVRRLCDPEV